jgi:hypothetical protein
MIKVNVMGYYMQTLKGKGWKIIPLTGYNDIDVKALRKRGKTIILIEYINVYLTVDIEHNVDVFFKGLEAMLTKFDAKEIYLPGGDDFEIPDLFTEFCQENAIRINLIYSKMI